MKSKNNRCVGFPEGSCNADVEPTILQDSKPSRNLCYSCRYRRGQKIRKKKSRQLQQRQDEHELKILKILMSELSTKGGREAKGLNSMYFLNGLFDLIKNETDYKIIGNKVKLLFNNIDLEETSKKVWWTVSHMDAKAHKGWDEGGVPTYFTQTNNTQIPKFLAKLEGVWCEKCRKNYYNLSENICKNPECPGRQLDPRGDMEPSTNEVNRFVCAKRKRARLKNGEIERITEENPDPLDDIKNNDGNIVWRITLRGATRVAYVEQMNWIQGRED